MVQRTILVSIFLCLALLPAVPASDGQVRSLSFEDRVRAQEAIERVYFAHQIGVTRTFDQVVSRDLLERKVRTYLEQSEALEQLWDRRITNEALRREWDRIVRHTRYPDRLRQIAEALGWDPLLLFECLARPALANRLVGNLYARDDRLHTEARNEANRVRALLIDGDFEAASSRAQLHQVHMKRVDGESLSNQPAHLQSTPADPKRPRKVELDAGTYRARRSRAPRSVGQVSQVIEGRSAFEIRMVLEESAEHARIASYFVPKQDRDIWWDAARGSFDGKSVTPFTELTAEELRLATEGVLGFAGAFDPSCLPDDTWDNGILEDPNPARDGHSAVWTGTDMIIWGGGELDSGMRYDPLLDAYTPISRENAPSPRSFHTAVWTGSEMIVWGGWPLSTTGGRYDPAQDSWTPITTTDAPEGRFDHTAVWTGYAMVVWGGNTDGSRRLDSGSKYFPAADVWTTVATGSSAPQARDRHSAVWTGSEMIIWGGTGMASDYLDDGSRYDPILDQWSALPTTGSPSGRTDHVAVWAGNRMLVWGGVNLFGYSSTGRRYFPATDRWSAIATAGAPVAGDGEVAVWTGDEMVVWGGTDPGAQGRYDPASNSWSTTSTGPNAPSAAVATAVWTGDSMIVWSPASGGRYDPQADSWNATLQLEVADGPSDRSGHTAVWTGSHMIIWGGPVSADPLGSRYDPLLETWTPISSVSAPVPRTGHTAVWTGDEMIVWGGDAAGGLQATGGRYDPAGDSWQPTASLDAPSARSEHSAVWTGSRMLIWSGFVGGDPLTQAGCETAYTPTGATYDPDTDGWSATTTTGASEGRGLHTAVWTGSEMLVWGGWHWVWSSGAGLCTQEVAVAEGSRYDPVPNSWIPITSAGEPSARFDHTAVWTGDAMVIWGGSLGSTMLDSGGRYVPLSDSWESTTLNGAPAPRAGHTAIWTGDEMVVWGGGSFLRSGGRYQPVWDIWRETNLAGAPAPRDEHSAVWTADLMIVWGGSEPLGGRYALGHPDNDGDGIADGCLACPDGPGDDSDADGHVCSSDNCPFDSNPTQADDDDDGWGDACDPCLDDPINDADNDLVCHSVDNCVGAYNPSQSDADGDGAGDVCDDNDDDDSLPDTADNCPEVPNDDQTDSDGDGAGNACDPCIWDPVDDADGDGFCSTADNCPTTPNRTQRDEDRDGVGDACDICPSDPNDAVIGDGLCFAPQVIYPVDTRPTSITAGYFDDDEFAELATSNVGHSDITVLPNNGDGSFGPTETLLTEERPEFIRAADMNGDGISDLVVINTKWNSQQPAPGSASVLIGTGAGFEPRVDYSVGWNPKSVAVADYDRDGNLDLIVSNRETSDLSFLRGTPYGNLYDEVFFPTYLERKPELVSSGDFNNDRIPDLAVSIYNDDWLQVYLGQGDGSFATLGEAEMGTGGTIYSHSVGDFNEDGNSDLAISHASSTYNLVTILTGTGTGEFQLGDEFTAGREGRSLQVGDFNLDGHDDIVMANSLDWDISILTGDGNLGFDDEVRFPVEPWPFSVTIGNLTGDGRHSLAVANILVDNISVLLNLGPIGGSPPVADAGPGSTWIVPAESPTGATVSLDGSGSTDLDSTPGTADDIILYEWIKDFGQSNQAFLGVGKTLDVFLGLGGHRIGLRTTDKTGRSDTDYVVVTVMNPDLLPDLVLEFNPPTLWPPNHRLVELQVSIIPGPTCSSPSAILGEVTSTEDDDAPGPDDGETVIDIDGAISGVADHLFSLRAERSALTPGRTYYVTYAVSCGPGNVKPILFSFTVPYEKNGTAEPLQIVLDETDEGTLVAWMPVEGAQDYDVIRGSLSNLQVLEDSYGLGNVTCIEANSTDESTLDFEDPDEPLPGEFFYYLVQYHGEDDSGYGTESAVKPRIPGGGDCL